MNGETQINNEVKRILNTSTDIPTSIIRLWRNRFKLGKLSLEKRIFIIEHYGNKEIILTIKTNTP